MPEFTIIEVAESPYLYVERTVPMAEVATAMQSGLGEVRAFMEHHGVPAAGGGLSVYHDMPGESLRFRTGFLIRRDDMAAADGTVKADVTPAGRALHTTHRGAYGGLGATYQAMWAHLKTEGLTPKSPSWEVYLNNPAGVHEQQLLTEIYQSLA